MSRSRSSLSLVVALALLSAASGCAEVVASSKRPRETGNRALTNGEYTDAAGAFRQAVRQDPLDYRAWYGLGQCYDKSEAYHQAMQAYRTALDVRKRTLPGKEDEAMRVKIIDALGRSMAAAGGHGFGAEPAGASSSSAGRQSNAEEKYIAAKAFQYMGDADSAIETYQQASMLDKKDFAIAKDYGLYLEKLPSMREQAVKQLKRAYQLNTQDQQVIMALRRNGVVPGPSLKEPEQLARPAVPKGPLPEMDIKRWQQEREAAARQRAMMQAGAGAGTLGPVGAAPADTAGATAGPRD